MSFEMAAEEFGKMDMDGGGFVPTPRSFYTHLAIPRPIFVVSFAVFSVLPPRFQTGTRRSMKLPENNANGR